MTYRFSCLMILLAVLFYSCEPSEPSDTTQQKETMTKEIYGYLYVGTYTQKEGHVEGKAAGVYCYKMNYETGELSYVSTLEGLINPSFLAMHPNQKWLYAVNEHGGTKDFSTGTVSAIKIGADHQMSLLNQVSAEGAAPCHLSISKDHKAVLVANYVGGNVARLPIIEEGQLAKADAVLNFSGEQPHAHYIQSLDDSYYVMDLGEDVVYTLNINSKKNISIKEKTLIEKGAGPRQAAHHPTEKFTYVLNELKGTINLFLREVDSLVLQQTISTTSEKVNKNVSSAAIRVTPNGKYLYVSNRAKYNNIAIFSIDQKTGKLTSLGYQTTFGKTPRDFEIDPSGEYLLVANQDTDNVITFKIAPNGTLKKVAETKIPTPVCLIFQEV